jgi:hypothetical protein
MGYMTGDQRRVLEGLPVATPDERSVTAARDAAFAVFFREASVLVSDRLGASGSQGLGSRQEGGAEEHGVFEQGLAQHRQLRYPARPLAPRFRRCGQEAERANHHPRGAEPLPRMRPRAALLRWVPR